MVKNRLRFLSSLLLVFCMLTGTVNAQGIVPYASDQLDAYDIDVVPCANGKISIGFSVEGTGTMKSIGASKIRIFERYGSDGWMIAKVYTQTDPGMSVSNRHSYTNSIDYWGTSGVEYKIEVTIFATDSAGTDSRTLITYVTAL